MARKAEKWFSMRTEFFGADAYDLGIYRLSPAALASFIAGVAYASRWNLDYCFGEQVVTEVTGQRRLKVVSELVGAGFWWPNPQQQQTHHIAHEGALWRRGDARQRRAVPIEIRALVMERDGFACAECGSTDRLSLDHIFPYSKGGQDTVENLRVLCLSCNSRKGDRLNAS